MIEDKHLSFGCSRLMVDKLAFGSQGYDLIVERTARLRLTCPALTLAREGILPLAVNAIALCNNLRSLEHGGPDLGRVPCQPFIALKSGAARYLDEADRFDA